MRDAQHKQGMRQVWNRASNTSPKHWHAANGQGCCGPRWSCSRVTSQSCGACTTIGVCSRCATTSARPRKRPCSSSNGSGGGRAPKQHKSVPVYDQSVCHPAVHHTSCDSLASFWGDHDGTRTGVVLLHQVRDAQYGCNVRQLWCSAPWPRHTQTCCGCGRPRRFRKGIGTSQCCATQRFTS